MKPLKFFLVLILTSGCRIATKYKYKRGEVKDMAPPGCIQLGSNYFIDETEATNLNWREYMFWQERHFGAESTEYLQTIPDSIVFIETWSNDTLYIENWDVSGYYLANPYNQDLPVVGLDLSQINKYAEWRSNRVFEMILIRDGYLDPNTESTFSLQKMMDKQYEFKRELPDYFYYPKYRVPSIEDYNKAIESSFNESFRLKCVSKTDTLKIKKGQRHLNNNITYNNHFKTRRLPLLERYYVELTNDGDTIPRIWFDQGLDSIDSTNLITPNVVLCGFRNACEWVKIKVPK